MKTDDLSRDVKIDPERLDVECLKQAEIFFAWAEKAAAARSEKERAEFAFEVLEAELQLKCRSSPEEFGLGEKVTEATVKAAVVSSSEYQKGFRKMMEARDTSSMLDRAVAALEMKKRMLETLVTLHGQQYFAGPDMPHDLPKLYAKSRKEQDREINQRMARVVKRRRERKE